MNRELVDRGFAEAERVIENVVGREVGRLGTESHSDMCERCFAEDGGSVSVSVLAVCAAHVLGALGAFRPAMGRLVGTPFTVVKANERELWEQVQVTAWALAYVLDRMGNADTLTRLSGRSCVHGAMVQGTIDESLERWGVLTG